MSKNADKVHEADDLLNEGGDAVAQEEDVATGERAPSEELGPDDKAVPSAIPDEVLSTLPKDARAVVEFFEAQLTRSRAPVHPLLDKVTSEHIPLLIESMDRDTQLGYKDAQRRQSFSILYCLIGLGALAFLVLTLGASNPDLLEKVIAVALGFVGGLGTGLGLGRRKD